MKSAFRKRKQIFAMEASADLCLHEELNLANVHHQAVKRQKIQDIRRKSWIMKRNSKQFLALFMAVAMSVTPVSYAYAEETRWWRNLKKYRIRSADRKVTDGKIGAAEGRMESMASGRSDWTGKTTAGQGTDENQKSQEEPKAEENAATGNVTEAEKKQGEDGKSEG